MTAQSTASEEPPPGRTPFPAKRVFAFGLPLAIGMGGHAFFNLADLWIVGPLGASALAAVTIASLVNTLAMVVMQGVTDGSVALIARAVGAGDWPRASRVMAQSLGLAALLAVVLGVPPWLYARELTAFFGAEGAALEHGTACLEVMSLGSGTMFLLMQVGAGLRAAGWARAPAILLLGGNALNVLLNYGLVHGRWGMPELGVVGTAWGTVTSRAVFGSIGLFIVLGSALRPARTAWRPRMRLLAPLLRLGLPVSGQWVVRVLAILAVLAIIAPGGAAAQAAYGIGGRLDTLALFATVGWGSAAATAVGQGLGARDPDGAARAAWTAVGWGVLTMVLAAIAWMTFAPGLVGFFATGGSAAPVVVEAGTTYLRTVAFGYPAIGVAIVLSLALAGAGSVKTALLIEGVVLLGLQVPLAWAFAPTAASPSLAPVWWVVVATQGLLALAYAGVFLGGRWRRKTLWEETPEPPGED